MTCVRRASRFRERLPELERADLGTQSVSKGSKLTRLGVDLEEIASGHGEG